MAARDLPLVTGAGELTLDPVLKALVGRLRPVVAHPIAYGNGDSFPSGHALGSIVCYGALFLVFLPATRGTWRRVFIVVICTLIAAIGISRLLLGVHYLSDVLGAWALGITWLGLTAFAFELSRQATGAPVTDPVTEGLEPEARTDLQPAEPETTMHHDRAREYGRIAAGVVVIWVLIVGALTGIGKLIMITHNGNGNLLGDDTIPHWFAAHRTPVAEPLEPDRQQPRGHPGHPHRKRRYLRRVPRRHPSLAAGDLRRRGHARRTGRLPDDRGHGEATAAGRLPPRLEPAHLRVPVRAHGRDHVPVRRHRHPGHRHARGWWRYLFLIPAIVMPVMIAVARMYRGEHHPTDILASLLFAALWLTATTMLIKAGRGRP